MMMLRLPLLCVLLQVAICSMAPTASPTLSPTTAPSEAPTTTAPTTTAPTTTAPTTTAPNTAAPTNIPSTSLPTSAPSTKVPSTNFPSSSPTTSPTGSGPRFLRAGCRTGHPPFSEWDYSRGVCYGMSYELFQRACELANIQWNISALNISSTDAIQRGIVDISVSVTSINPLRLTQVRFSQPFVELELVGVLHEEKFGIPATTLTDALFSTSILFLFEMMMLMVLGLAVVIAVAEGRIKASPFMAISGWDKRILYAVEISLANALTFNCGEYASQITRSLRALFAIIMYFFSCLFTSIISAALTSATLGADNPNILSDVRGSKLWCGENPTTATFLSSPKVNAHASYVSTLFPTAMRILAGTVNADGFVTSPEEARAFLAMAPDAKFVLTDPFTLTGLPEPRAFAISNNITDDLFRDFGVALSKLRESGEIARMLGAYVPVTLQSNEVENLGISATQESSVRGIAIAGYVIFLAVVALLFFIHFRHKKQLKSEAKRLSKMYDTTAPTPTMGLGKGPCMVVQFKTDANGKHSPLTCTAVSTNSMPVSLALSPQQSDYLTQLLSLCDSKPM